MAIPVPVHYPGRLLKVVPKISRRIRAAVERGVQQVAAGMECLRAEPIIDLSSVGPAAGKASWAFLG